MDTGGGTAMELQPLLPQSGEYRPRADEYRRMGRGGYSGSAGGGERPVPETAVLYLTPGRI